MNPTNPLDEALASQISPLCYDVFALQDHTDLDLDALYITKRFSKKVLDRALESHTSLSYDDVLIRPGHADFNLGEVDLTTRFSKKVSLKIPIVSAAMDTVTEYQMAIAIAIEGGLGIIHRNMTPEKQAHQVRKVKRHLNGLIDNPEWVDGEETLNEIRVRFANKYGGLRYHSFPILNDESRLIGILGEKSFRYGDQNKTAQQAALEQMETGNRGEGVQETTIREAYKIMNEKRIGSLPLTDKEGKLNGMYVFSDVERIITGAGTYNTDDKEQLIVGAAIGVHEDAERRLEQLVEANVDVVVIDSSHGDSENVIETLKKIKSQSKYNHIDVVVGNVSVGESVERLVDAGADGIKVGQGPGSICTTRVVAGAGRGQMIAIYDCARKARGYGIPLCADGGIVYSGDITKAIAGGADSVMLGGLLAGVEESPGETMSTWHGVTHLRYSIQQTISPQLKQLETLSVERKFS